MCFWVCAACSDVLAWSAKQEQSADVFEELGEKEEEEEKKKKVFVHGLWSSPRRRWCALDGIDFEMLL